ATDDAARAAAGELAGRARLLRGLLAAQASVLSPAGADCAAQERRFGHWLTRLQAAWYAGDAALARQAAARAPPLAHPLTPRADANATRRRQHWLAALAAEQAALQAADTGLASAARHYRREALASCCEWGAFGRAEALCRAWGEAMPAAPSAPAPAAPGATQ